MKKKILLLDESITVQKVITLTLDKNFYDVVCTRGMAEAKMSFQQSSPDLILVSDQTSGIRAADFPNEVASWTRPLPPPSLVLITTSEISDMRGYAGILRKPFSPRALQSIVADQTAEKTNLSAKDAKKEIQESVDDFDAQRLESLFNTKFADESQLVRETFNKPTPPAPASQAAPASLRPSAPPPVAPHLRPVSPSATAPVSNLWAPSPNPPPPAQPQNLWGTLPAQRPGTFHTAAASTMDTNELEARINQLLNEIVPPIVERLVKERLDALLNEARKSPAYSQRSR